MSRTIWFLCLAVPGVWCAEAAYADVLYSEDFTGQVGKGVIGVAGIPIENMSGVDWSIDYSDTSLGIGDYFMVTTLSGSAAMTGEDLDGDAIWRSPVVDISNYSDLSFSLDALEQGNLAGGDYFNVEYIIDGTTYFIADWNGKGGNNQTLRNDWTSETITAAGFSGSTFQFQVTMHNNKNGERMMLDNVQLQGTVTTPEPSTFVWLAGLGGIIWWRRSRRQKRKASSNETPALDQSSEEAAIDTAANLPG